MSSIVAAGVRAALRRPWRVEAVLPGATERRLTWDVAGWAAAGRLADQVRAEIAAGAWPITRAAGDRLDDAVEEAHRRIPARTAVTSAYRECRLSPHGRSA